MSSYKEELCITWLVLLTFPEVVSHWNTFIIKHTQEMLYYYQLALRIKISLTPRMSGAKQKTGSHCDNAIEWLNGSWQLAINKVVLCTGDCLGATNTGSHEQINIVEVIVVILLVPFTDFYNVFSQHFQLALIDSNPCTLSKAESKLFFIHLFI